MAKAALTLGRLAEQIYLLYSGSTMLSGAKTSTEEIKYLLVQQINRLLKVERLQETNVSDYRLPDTSIISNYTVTTITADGDRSYFELPAYPISAPHGMGIYEVIVEDTVDSIEYEMVPIPSGYMRTFLSIYPNWKNKFYAFQESFGGATGGWYTWDGGRKVILNSADYAADHRVKVKLLVVDISTMSDDDILPVPADMEATVIESVMNILRARLPEDKVIDDNSTR